MPSGHESVIAGSTKTGRLISVGPNSFIGERIGPKRVMESKRFNCKRSQIVERWKAWQEEAKQEAYISVTPERKPAHPKAEQPVKEKPDVPTPTKQASRPDAVYLLAFKGQRTSKPLAAYLDLGEAISMQDALTVALDVQGLEGEYTVDEIPVWPRKEN